MTFLISVKCHGAMKILNGWDMNLYIPLFGLPVVWDVIVPF